MHIVRVDQDGHERIVIRGITDRAAALNKLVELARDAAVGMPNHPKVDQCGPNEVGVYIGLYKVRAFRLEDPDGQSGQEEAQPQAHAA